MSGYGVALDLKRTDYLALGGRHLGKEMPMGAFAVSEHMQVPPLKRMPSILYRRTSFAGRLGFGLASNLPSEEIRRSLETVDPDGLAGLCESPVLIPVALLMVESRNLNTGNAVALGLSECIDCTRAAFSEFPKILPARFQTYYFQRA